MSVGSPRARPINISTLILVSMLISTTSRCMRLCGPQVGYGLAAVTSSFFPMAPPDVQDEPEECQIERPMDFPPSPQ